MVHDIFRWDISSINQLSDYMQICYRALLDVFEAANEELAKQERSYHISYAKDTIRTQVYQINFSCLPTF